MIFESFPNPKLIRSIYEQAYIAQVLRMALLLDLFSSLKNGPSTAKTVAKKCSSNPVGIEKLLECIYTFGLLEKMDHEYYLSDTARTFFLKETPTYVGNWVLELTNPVVFGEILNSIRTGQTLSLSLPWHQLAWLESYATDRIDLSLDMWAAAGIYPGADTDFHVLDLACGSGIVSLALAQRYSQVQVTGIDGLEVVKVAQDLAKRLSVQDRANFVAGDMHVLSFEKENYDVVLLGNATGFLTPEQNKALFQKAYRSLKSGGSLILDVTMKTESKMRNENLGMVSLLLWTLSGTEYYSFEDYENWLSSGGYTDIKQLSNLWLSAKKHS